MLSLCQWRFRGRKLDLWTLDSPESLNNDGVVVCKRIKWTLKIMLHAYCVVAQWARSGAGGGQNTSLPFPCFADGPQVASLPLSALPLHCPRPAPSGQGVTRLRITRRIGRFGWILSSGRNRSMHVTEEASSGCGGGGGWQLFASWRCLTVTPLIPLTTRTHAERKTFKHV